jgi:hypothetical protein
MIVREHLDEISACKVAMKGQKHHSEISSFFVLCDFLLTPLAPAPINLFTIDIPGHTNPPKCLVEVCTRALQSRLEAQIHSKRQQPGTLPGPPSSAVVFRI